jgi:hypothetical protein
MHDIPNNDIPTNMHVIGMSLTSLVKFRTTLCISCFKDMFLYVIDMDIWCVNDIPPYVILFIDILKTYLCY